MVKRTPYAELARVVENLPLLLTARRQADGLSLRAAAKEMGVSFSTLTRIEAGAGYQSDILPALLRWLDGKPSDRNVRQWSRRMP